MTVRLTLVIALAGCFGSGPTPTQPTGVTAVFVAPAPTDSCSNWVYIGGIAFGMTHGYAVTVPYIPSGPGHNCCNSGGCPTPTGTSAVYQFEKGGAMPLGTLYQHLSSVSGTMGGTVNAFPRMAVFNGDTPVWALPDNTDSNMTLSTLGMSQPLSGAGAGGVLEPAGLVADGGSIYVAGWGGSGPVDVDNPDYPCCGNNNNTTTGRVLFNKVPYMNGMINGASALLTSPPVFECGTATRCLVQSTAMPDVGNLFFFAHEPTTGTLAVYAFPKTGTVQNQLNELLQLDPSKTPVGLAANPTDMVWAESANYNMGPNVPAGCEIGKWDGANPASRVFMTNQFSCMGIALDDAGFVYMTIVAPEQDDCGSCSQVPLQGVGIARFNLSDPMGTFESRALHLSGITGVRRLAIDNQGTLFAIDPSMIVRYDKDVLLGGAHDFTP